MTYNWLITIENFTLAVFIAICTLILHYNFKKEIKEALPKYKVYYEYNIINHDTIPVDTIYIKFKN